MEGKEERKMETTEESGSRIRWKIKEGRKARGQECRIALGPLSRT